ncbi:hypothetical protein OHB56_02740 [Streptomyces sp. NBC_01635]|uniref:hypothetical protein n=1 Tax=Streptomyces sp. NBC_01635 TaxID=2975904 RepID=UPI00386BE937|nr:hypothetical protein OHB56_02740 [Streptomyces sp. NBC_01635]
MAKINRTAGAPAMLAETEALDRAKTFLSEQSPRTTSHAVRIAEDATVVDGGRLIAVRDTRGFLDKDNDMMRLGGNLPVAVDLSTGVCSFACAVRELVAAGHAACRYSLMTPPSTRVRRIR